MDKDITRELYARDSVMLEREAKNSGSKIASTRYLMIF